ncbi:hypothetical protein PRIPAC_86847, partial [Pristionchus pacificus]
SQMGGEKFNPEDLQAMAYFLYSCCQSNDTGKRTAAQTPNGNIFWRLFNEHEERFPTRGSNYHPVASLQTKYSRFHRKFHTVEGIDPKKVLFIYKYYNFTFNGRERNEIRSAFPRYTIHFAESGAVRNSYLTSLGGDSDDDDDDEEEDDEEEEEEEVKPPAKTKDSKHRRSRRLSNQ